MTDNPTYSIQLWSEAVALAKAGEPEQKEPAYEFTGRTFVQPDDLYLNDD